MMGTPEEVQELMVDDGTDPVAVTEQEVMEYMALLTSADFIPAADGEALEDFFRFSRELNYEDLTYIDEVDEAFAGWRAGAGVTLAGTPVTYHVSQIMQLSLTTSQASLTYPNKIPAGLNQKIDDGQLCSIRHRNWLSERLGLCGAVNNSALATLLSNTVRGQITSAASNEFNKVSRAIATRVFAPGSGELSQFQSIGLRLLQNAMSTAIAGIVDALWDEAFCQEQCDNCGSALGIARNVTSCTFRGITAVGSQFEDNEGLTFLFDYNLDGVVDGGPGLTFTPFLPASAISNNGRPFNVRVNVTCDGNTQFPWPGGGGWTRIDPNASSLPLAPTATFSGPAQIQGYYFRPNTRLCFSATIVSNGWEYLGWTAVGGNPASGTGSSLCSTWTDIGNPIPRNFALRFRDPCSGQIRLVSGPSFLICPTGYC